VRGRAGPDPATLKNLGKGGWDKKIYPFPRNSHFGDLSQNGIAGEVGVYPTLLLTYGGPLSHMCMSQDIQISTAWVIGASQSEQGHRSLKDIPLTWAPSTGLENRLHHRCNHLESSDTHILHALPTYPQAHPLSSPSECGCLHGAMCRQAHTTQQAGTPRCSARMRLCT
jgi:hypothetical protein